jgi:hypothetical protein
MAGGNEINSEEVVVISSSHFLFIIARRIQGDDKTFFE